MRIATNLKFLVTCIMTAMTLGIQACSSGSSNDAAPGSPPVTDNRPPAISGSPPASAMQGSNYSFTPTASDPDGDVLTFSAVNVPDWAAFDAATGNLSGIPAAQHVGQYAAISISVSDGMDSAMIGPFTIDVIEASAGSFALSWMAPTQSADGSPLTDLAGYRIYWGTQSGDRPNVQQIDNAGVTTAVIDGLAPGTYFFAITAIDVSGNESVASNEVSGTLP